MLACGQVGLTMAGLAGAIGFQCPNRAVALGCCEHGQLLAITWSSEPINKRDVTVSRSSVIALEHSGPHGRRPSRRCASRREGHGDPSSTQVWPVLPLLVLTYLIPNSVGFKVTATKDAAQWEAEILSRKDRKGHPLFYVHYTAFNKRLDEWISADRIDLTKEVEFPPEKTDVKKDKKQAPNAKTSKADTSTSNTKTSKKRPRDGREVSATPIEPSRAATTQPSAGGKENKDPTIPVLAPDITIQGTPQPEEGDDDDEDGLDLVDVQTVATAAKAAADHAPYSREEEIEKLRVGGSMTQNQTEISRVRNLERLQMGTHEIEPWYFSPYPAEFSDVDMVYICEMCLLYFGSECQFKRHRTKCTVLYPPGNEIYRDDTISFFEIDGRRQRTWCRNLCLLSKLFLDHKTLYYDVDPFLFYCMTIRSEHGHHLVGYFSKEKESAEGYNVACILTLPQYQRKGYGKLLIAFSYELSRRENKLGSPEKPLSDLGLLGYRAYWQELIVDYIVTATGAGSTAGGSADADGDTAMGTGMIRRSEMSVDEIATALAMTTNDVVHTLQYLNMLRYTVSFPPSHCQ